MLPVPPILMRWLAPFAAFFTKPTWDRVLVLATGAILAPGRRTVTAQLSVLGRREEADFARFHGVLNPARWSGRSLARTLLRWLVAVFDPPPPRRPGARGRHRVTGQPLAPRHGQPVVWREPAGTGHSDRHRRVGPSRPARAGPLGAGARRPE
jgi:hypothetical protein